jgi:hypothetical protein
VGRGWCLILVRSNGIALHLHLYLFYQTKITSADALSISSPY